MSREKRYNDKECFEAWILMGSHKRASKYLKNKYPDDDFKWRGVRIAALRYILWNSEEARPHMIGRRPEYEIDDLWYIFLVETAMGIYRNTTNHRQRAAWFAHSGLLGFAKEMGVVSYDYNPVLNYTRNDRLD